MEQYLDFTNDIEGIIVPSIRKIDFDQRVRQSVAVVFAA
jgi:hypothetical protein